MKRVVVTGAGLITPIGHDIVSFWENLVNGESGIGRLAGVELANLPVRLAATVKDLDLSVLPKRDVKFDAKFTSFARIAAKEAWADADIDIRKEDANRIGAYISTSIGGSETLSNGVRLLDEKGPSRISPYFLQSVLPNAAAAKVSIDLGIHGDSVCHVAACASGSVSIGEAFLKIQNGSHDMFVAGAADASITPLTLAGFAAMHAIYTADNLEGASIPFDLRRGGFVIGEGAGVLVLEELSHALKRNARIYAEIVGYSSNSDAFNMVSPDYEGLSSKKAMLAAIEQAGEVIDKIGYINAHGTSTILGDKTEAKAIHEIWEAKSPFVSSIKSQIGHLLSASGAVEAIATILMLKNDFIPAVSYDLQEDPECRVCLPREAQNIEMEYALSNSFGFGGHNSCLVFKKWMGK